MGTTIQLYAAAVPANSLASIDVPMTGDLVGVDWQITVAASGADSVNMAQVAFGSTLQDASNDARNVISNCGVSADLTTSGAAVTFANKYVPLPSLHVAAGERIYLHGGGTAITMTIRAILHFTFDLDRPSARRR